MELVKEGGRVERGGEATLEPTVLTLDSVELTVMGGALEVREDGSIARLSLGWSETGLRVDTYN